MIEQLIADAAARTGLDPRQARAGLSGALALMQRHGEATKLAELFSAIPGAADLAREGQALAEQKSGGLMSGLMKNVGGAGGAAMSDAMAMGQKLARQGVTTSDMQAMLPVAMTFVRERAGKDLLREVLATVPGLGKLLIGQA